jgi:hypothetical protein
MSAQPLEIRMAHLEGAYEQLDKRLGDLAAAIDSRFAQVDVRFDGVDRKIDSLQWRMTSLIVGTWITTILAVILRH